MGAHLRWVPPRRVPIERWVGAAAYRLSTPRTSHRAPPCTSTFLSSLVENEFFTILLSLGEAYPSVILRAEGLLRCPRFDGVS